MHNSLKAVAFSTLPVVLSVGLHAETHQHDEMNVAGDALAQQIVRRTGVAKDVDFNSKKITISYEAVPTIGWPAMVMRFTFVNADDNITALKAGTHVDFMFVQQGSISLFKSINNTQP